MNTSDATITLRLFSSLHVTRPPSPEAMTEKKAEQAEALLSRFINSTGVDRCAAVAELLNNLIHWCDHTGLVFDDELTRARDQYVAETDADTTI